MVRTAGRCLRRMHARSMHSTSGVYVCCLASNGTNLYGTEANEATQTHCYNPVAPAYPIWAYYVHGRQRRCQEDPVSLPSGRLKKTTRSSLHHVAQRRPTGSETTPPYAPRSSRFGSEPPSVEDDVDIWHYAILRVACQKRRCIYLYQLLYIWVLGRLCQLDRSSNSSGQSESRSFSFTWCQWRHQWRCCHRSVSFTWCQWRHQWRCCHLNDDAHLWETLSWDSTIT